LICVFTAKSGSAAEGARAKPDTRLTPPNKHIYKCPLINAISTEKVIPHYSELVIEECGLYKK